MPIPEPQAPKTLHEKVVDGDYNTKLSYPAARDYPNDGLGHDAFVAMRNAYRADQSARDELFKADVFAHYGITDNPRRERCYGIAYERGHSAGKSEVLVYFGNIVELILPLPPK